MSTLTRQDAEHRAERDQQADVVAAADAHLAEVRAQLAGPLVELATADGAAYLTAQERMWQANRSQSNTGRLGRRAASRTAREAIELHGATENAVRRRWGGVPQTTTHLPCWAEAVAGQRVDVELRHMGRLVALRPRRTEPVSA